MGINGLRKRNGLVGFLADKDRPGTAAAGTPAPQTSRHNSGGSANQARNAMHTSPPPPPPRQPPSEGVAAKSAADSAMMTGHVLQASPASAAATVVRALPPADGDGGRGSGGSSGRSVVMGTVPAAGSAMGLGSTTELPGTPVAGGQTGLYTQRADAELHALEAELMSSGPPSPDRHAENV